MNLTVTALCTVRGRVRLPNTTAAVTCPSPPAATAAAAATTPTAATAATAPTHVLQLPPIAAEAEPHGHAAPRLLTTDLPLTHARDPRLQVLRARTATAATRLLHNQLTLVKDLVPGKFFDN